MRDEEMWAWWGNYGMSALIVAISHCFSKKSQAKYIKEPLLSRDFDNVKLTEEEKQRQVDLFFARENARRVNWKRNHRKDDSVS